MRARSWRMRGQSHGRLDRHERLRHARQYKTRERLLHKTSFAKQEIQDEPEDEEKSMGGEAVRKERKRYPFEDKVLMELV